MNSLPLTIRNYLDASNQHDIEKIVAYFSPDATVHDVGENLKIDGRTAIQQWLKKNHSQYRLQVRPLETTNSTDTTQLLAEVSGDFDGSPLKFLYEFKLRDGLISQLSTTFVDD